MDAEVQPDTDELTVYNFDNFHKRVAAAQQVRSHGKQIIDLRMLGYIKVEGLPIANGVCWERSGY